MPEQIGAFVAAVDGLRDAARALGVPFVSGNVSLYNRSSSGNHVAPSPIVGCVGTIDGRLRARATHGLQARRLARSFVDRLLPRASRLGGSVHRRGARSYAVDGACRPDRLSRRVRARSARCVRAALRARRLALRARATSPTAACSSAIAEMALCAGRRWPAFRHRMRIDAIVARTDGARTTTRMVRRESPGFVLEVADAQAFDDLSARAARRCLDAWRASRRSRPVIERSGDDDRVERSRSTSCAKRGQRRCATSTPAASRDARAVAVVVFPGHQQRGRDAARARARSGSTPSSCTGRSRARSRGSTRTCCRAASRTKIAFAPARSRRTTR